MRTLRPATTRDVVVIAVAVILLIVAGSYLALRGGGEDSAPDDQYVDFRCEACGESFRLSYREFEELWNKNQFTRAEDGRTLLFKCPKCGQMTAKRLLAGEASPTQPE